MVKAKKIKVLCVVGARPNFIKIASLLEAFKKYPRFKPILVHTGQHYDYKMSGLFFNDLGIPRPDYNLGVGSGSHAWQTGKIMIELEGVCLKERPDLVIVVGDVNSTLAGTLAAVKLPIPVAHIEAGLRSFDRQMPEEINRILTDQIADYLFVAEPSAIKNLLKEGIARKKIFYVGNTMIDSLKKSKVKSQKLKVFERFGLKKKNYAVLTLHRPSNVDNPQILKNLFGTFKIISRKIPIVFPIHPRTQKQLKKFGLEIRNWKLKIISPLGYVDMLCLMANSKFIMTDSGGIQEEATALGTPCLTLRENTERPITVTRGTNVIVGCDQNKIIKEVYKILSGHGKRGRAVSLWDGRAAQRIIKLLKF